MERLALICVGAGSGRRYGGDKLAERLGSATVLECSLLALQEALPEAPLILVVAADRRKAWQDELGETWQELHWVDGGARRQDSVRAGVERATELGADKVLIHDAARPLVHPDDVRATADGLETSDGVILCAPVVDTIKRVDGGGRILETVDRAQLRAAQTPQGFRIAVLERAWKELAEHQEWTDEAGILEAAGCSVRAVTATHPNPKLTHMSDLHLLRSLVRKCS